MERTPVLSQSAIRKAVITTFVFENGRCRGSSPERSTPKRTPKPCRNVSAGAGDGECGTGGNDSRPGFSFAPQNVAGNGRPMPAETTMPCDLGPLGRQKSVFPGRNDVSCTADGHTWPGTDMGYNLRPPYLLLRQECTPVIIYPIYSLKIFKAYGSSLYRRKGLAGLRRKIGNAGRTGPAAGTPVRAEDGQQLNRLAGRMSCAGSQQADAAILPGKGTDPVLQRRRKVFLPGKRCRGVSRIENRT